VLSRKSSINKNSFYRSKAVGKVPDYLPNKPTVVGSRGQIPPSNYYNKASAGGVGGVASPKLPGLSSSGGIAANTPYGKGSALGSGKPVGAGYKPPPVYKYNSGIGGGIASNPYSVNYNQNS